MKTTSPFATTQPHPRYKHALVIGGSIAGMATAQILTRHVERVTILERDHIPAAPDFRKGVPQARHAHILLGRGQEILEDLFPGLRRTLLEQGAVMVNMGSELAFFNSGSWGQPFPSAINMVGCSRPLLEDALRQQLRQNPQVDFYQEQEVLGLTTDALRQRATGVRLRDRRDGAASETTLAADLVVDASGRTSHAPRWLTELGYVAPEETTVTAFAGYTSRIYHRPAHLRASWKALYSMVSPPNFTRGGVILPMEGDLWQVTVMGMAKDYPPTDEAGFLAFLRAMPSPRMYEALKEAEPLTAPYGYRQAENRMRYYEKLPRYLDRVLRTMPHNPGVAEAFYHVQNMLKPPTSLFHPRILWQVLRQPLPQATAPVAPLTEVQAHLGTAGD